MWIVSKIASAEYFGDWDILQMFPTKSRAMKYAESFEHYNEDEVTLVRQIKMLGSMAIRLKRPGEWFKIVLGFCLPHYYQDSDQLIDIRFFFGIPFLMRLRKKVFDA